MVDLKTLFTFFANRNLLQWPKSINTLLSDIQTELSISSNEAIHSYNAMNKQFQLVKKIYNKLLDYSKFDKMNSLISSFEPIKEYNQIINLNKHEVLKNLYKVHIPNYIYLFIDSHKEYLPNDLISKVIPLITNITFNKKSDLLNDYIKRILLFKVLSLNIDKDKLLSYYNYNRFLYLYTIVKMNNFIPISYNINNGILYFSIPYRLDKKKEQIFEDTYQSLILNNTTIIFKYVRLYINTSIGEITQVKNLRDNSYNINDMIDYNVPNIIRKIIYNIIRNYSSKISYNQMLSYVFKNNIQLEDYCQKISNNGTIFKIPVNNQWIEISNKELKNYEYSDLDLNLLLNDYQEVINPIVKILSTFKNF